MKHTVIAINSNFVTLLLSFIACILVLFSCKKENKEDHLPPSYNILESEKLIIPDAVAVPENLPAGNTRVVTYYAEGIQKYRSQVKPGSDPVTYEWVFVAPEADLYDVTNKKVGTHGAGPYWEISASDSIFAQQYAPPKTATPDTSSIPWLLLMPKVGKTPTGIFQNVSYIQRIATKGGKAPREVPTAEGQIQNVKYTAVYRFTRKNG